MNTNKLKSFAAQARIDLMDAVGKQLLFWGFSEKDGVLEAPSSTTGGYIFRGNVYNDESVIAKWEQLKTKVTASKQGFADTAEEGAYTWFNRLLAIKILEENDFIEPCLSFVEGTSTPAILANAKSGKHSVSNTIELTNLQAALRDNEDEKAFAILITDFCNQHVLLKEVFGRLNDYTELLIPQNLLAHNGFLVALNDTDNITPEDYKEVELIGWLYQFYIADRKDEVFKGFKKNKKARAEDIPAATQIFTPKWIVSYMVENTLGKIYLDFEPDSELKEQMKYLVESEEETSTELISDLEELTLIDPASGSGHILVTGFEWLYQMYREQRYSPINAVKSILEHNIYGLEIDDRAMQLSRFAILVKAAQLLQVENTRQAHEFINNPIGFIPKIFAFPEAHSFVSEEIGVFTENEHVAEIYKAINLLKQGKNIGSALQLELSKEAIATLNKQYKTWTEKANLGRLDIQELGIWANLKAYVEIILTLTKKYSSVVANPPYMGQKNMNEDLKKYVNKNYPLSKPDLCTVFIEVLALLTNKNGKYSFIVPPSWLFLSSFSKLRKNILETKAIDSMLHLSRGIFGADFGSVTTVITNVLNKNAKGTYFRLVERTFQEFYHEHLKELFLLAKEDKNFKYEFILYSKDKPNLKHSDNGLNIKYPNILQSNFDKIPGSPIAYHLSENINNLFKENVSNIGDLFAPKQGLITGDNKQFVRLWHEVSQHQINIKWYNFNKGGEAKRWYGNREEIVNWENDGFDIKNFKNKNGKLRSRPQNLDYYFKEGLSWSKIISGDKGITFRYFDNTFIFSDAGMMLFPEENLYYILGLLNSKIMLNLINSLNPTLNKNIGDINRLPILINDAISVDEVIKNNISISKTDWDSRETSWDFEENPLVAEKADSLSQAYEQWKTKVSKDFFELHTNEEELNRIFIDIYGLQEELTPEVALRDITILQDELKAADLEAIEAAFRKGEAVDLPIQKDVVIQQLLSYFIGVIMGRYRLDTPGLHIAHPKPSAEELQAYSVENAAIPFSMEIDEDAIVPLMGDNCGFPDDAVRRIEKIIHNIWGDDSLIANQNFILDYLGMSMEKWLTEKFWAHHISGTMYKKTPIYWLFSSNPRRPHAATFNVLVYMHRMDGFTVQQILRNYLHPHQEYVNDEIENMQKEESSLDRAGMRKLESLRKYVEELKDYEEKLRSLANQQITFDLDDGVKENYKLFEGVVAVI